MENKEAASQCRPIDAKREWPFFDEDFAVPAELRERILALTRESAERLWQKEVSIKPQERHMMRLPSSHWCDPDQKGPNWESEWNIDSGREVQEFLRREMPLCDDETVYFMLMREHAYAMPIDVFVQCWRPFLGLDDEGPLLLHPESGRFVCFGPNGYLCAGQREFNQPMALVSRSKAALRIIGNDLAPEEITQLLGCEPTFSQMKGQELVGPKTGRIRVAKFGMWFLELAAREPENLEGQIHELLNRTSASLEVWSNISKRFEVDLFCGLFMEHGKEGFSISPKSLAALGSRGIELVFNVYGMTEIDN